MRILYRIKSKTLEGYSARTDICTDEVDGESTIWIVRVYITKSEKEFSTLLKKRGEIYIYADWIGFRHDTLRAVIECLKEILYCDWQNQAFRVQQIKYRWNGGN